MFPYSPTNFDLGQKSLHDVSKNAFFFDKTTHFPLEIAKKSVFDWDF